MKRTQLHIGLLTVVCLVAALFAVIPSHAQGEKKGSDQVKNSSPYLEVAELKPETDKCGAGKEGTFLRVRVTSDQPIDVRLHYQTANGRWSYKELTGKKKGEEITESSCYPKAKFKLQTRIPGKGEWTKI